MSDRIEWMKLFSYLTVILLIYYCCIVLYFYRKEIKALLKSKSVSGTSKKSCNSFPTFMSPGSASLKDEELHSILYNHLHELMEDFKPVFHAAVNQQLRKEQVLQALRVRVQQYPKIKDTAFQVAVTNHIALEMEHRLAVTLTDMEADSLWL